VLAKASAKLGKGAMPRISILDQVSARGLQALVLGPAGDPTPSEKIG
jgi:hypothetical protein